MQQDALLHPSFPLLVWLMAAVAKGYQLGATLAEACLAVVHDLACVPVKDHISSGESFVHSASTHAMLGNGSARQKACQLSHTKSKHIPSLFVRTRRKHLHPRTS